MVSSLAEDLGQTDLEDALRASEGLCLPHLWLCLQAVQDSATCEKLISIHREKLKALHGELAKLIRKNDYRFMKEGLGKEGDSWLQALGMVIGGTRQKK